ncbi:MAG: fibronectin type III domain-containing protein [Vicinamibacterales bacterium]
MKLRRVLAAAAAAAVLAIGTAVIAQSTAPGAPANLTYQVDGRTVYLNWINSPGAPAFYRLEAGGSPGTTFFTWDSSVLVDPTKLPQLLSVFATGGVGNGNYYVRVKGVNGAGESVPSNEIIVPVTGACQLPGAPADFTAVTRGSTVFMAWNPGNGGVATSYASCTPATSLAAASSQRWYELRIPERGRCARGHLLRAGLRGPTPAAPAPIPARSSSRRRPTRPPARLRRCLRQAAVVRRPRDRRRCRQRGRSPAQRPDFCPQRPGYPG